MLKTFSGKFFAVYALTTFVIFLLLFGVFSQIITDHFVSTKYRALLNECNTIETEYNDTYIKGIMSEAEYKTKLDTLSLHSATRIIMVNSDNFVEYDSEQSYSHNLVGVNLVNDLLKNSLNGETVTFIGDFNPYAQDTVIAVMEPINIDNDIIGSIIMYEPFPSVKEDITYVYNLILICFVIILFVTFISTYVFSRSITLTFKSFNNTAKEIASGDFSSRIDHNNFSTEVAELAESMNYMAEELEKLEDLRKDFIANISHDFRSPLTSIRGYVQAVIDGTIPPTKQEKYLNIVINETDRLAKLTNDILLLTKMENEVLRPEKEHFDLHETIRKILLQFEQKVVEKGIHITLLIEDEDVFVYADFNQIQRTITNILDNAIKFCGNGDEITIETTKHNEKVSVSIKDSGPGIPEEDIKHIWTRFHKVDRSRGKDKKGVGLGLSIVREIIKAHEETIEVYSKLGQGTTFVFTLTMSDPNDQIDTYI